MRGSYASVRIILVAIVLALGAWPASGTTSGTIDSPEDFLGHPVGADFKLARWETIVRYFRHVAERCARVNVRDLGTTTEGLPMIYAEVSSPETIRDVEPHRRNQERIADPRRLSGQEEEKRLVDTSKVVVLVNCSLHSSEVGASQMSMELLHDLATSTSERVAEILERTIILLVPSANPDGLNKVIDWYESSRGKPWEGTGMPWLYQRYAGHDNNRDWFMLNLVETRHLTRLIYEIWRPTIVYDIHQMGNRGARFFVPPFHDPKNANVPPLIEQTLLIIGGQMAQELSLAGKTGVIHGAIYDNWWAGGFRTTVYRHNMIGILTEAASANIASPVFQRKSELKGGRRGMASYQIAVNFPEPWPGGWWRLRDVVDYEKTACMSLFTYAARYHARLQGNVLHLGRKAIAAGGSEPPFAWLVPPGQRDPRTAAWMLELLAATGVEVHRADEPFQADGIPYPQGTFILYCAQPYRAHLMDMMERQHYPDREVYPGGPAEPPYDMAGWTLPLQMGVRRVSVSAPFEARTSRLDTIPVPQGRLVGVKNASSYLVPARFNDDVRLAARLHAAGVPFRVYTGGRDFTLDGAPVPAGSLLIPEGRTVRARARELLAGLSTDLIGMPSLDRGFLSVSPVAAPARLGLYQPWTASMDEGWTRFVLDQFEVEYSSVHNAEIIAGDLGRRYDALILPSLSVESILNGRAAHTTEPRYAGGIGAEGIVQLQDFVQDGGTLICIDRSCNLPVEQFNIPVRNVVAGKKSEEFFCPGSILRVRLDPSHPLAYGMPEWISAYFARSQAFEVVAEEEPASTQGEGDTPAAARGRQERRGPASRFPTAVVGRYSDTVLLESGWIRGEELIRDRPAILEVRYGAGRIVLLGFRVQSRGQPHGTFRLLFNAIQRSTLADIPGP
jgi:hypothetical protein